MRRTTRAVTVATPTGEILVTLESTERRFQYADMGLTFDSSDTEILEAIAPVIEEEEGIDILEDNLFTVKKVESSHNVFCFPKSPAGAF